MAAIVPKQSVLRLPGMSMKDKTIKTIAEIIAVRELRSFSRFSTRANPKQNLNRSVKGYALNKKFGAGIQNCNA